MVMLIKAATTCPSPLSFGYTRPQETLGGMQYDYVILIQRLTVAFYTGFC